MLGACLLDLIRLRHKLSRSLSLHLLVQNGLDTKVEKSRKQLKERKNRAKKIRGVKKTKAGDAAKAGKKK